MAAPQTHGYITFGLIWLILVVRGMNFLEFASAVIWGILIDADHFFSISYVKDLFRRIKQGGGPAPDVELPACWLHLWPGAIALLGFSLVLIFLNPSIPSPFSAIIPILFWATHILVDGFQKFPQKHILYPFIKTEYTPEIGYPVKPPAEFILGSLAWMTLAIGFMAWVLFLR